MISHLTASSTALAPKPYLNQSTSHTRQGLKTGPKTPVFAGKNSKKHSVWQQFQNKANAYARSFLQFLRAPFAGFSSFLKRFSFPQAQLEKPKVKPAILAPDNLFEERHTALINRIQASLDAIEPGKPPTSPDKKPASQKEKKQGKQLQKAAHRPSPTERPFRSQNEQFEEAQLAEALKLSQITADEEAARKLHHQINRANRPAATPALGRTRSLTTQDLFGNDLKSIRFEQKGANTCYLLSALDNIFQHPQGKKILDLIKIKQTGNDYEVQFPGQPRPIAVSHDELGQYAHSETPGVALLEQAYLNIPEAGSSTEFDTTNNALVRMFGADRVQQPGYGETTLAASAQTLPLVDEYAELWTATRRVKDRQGKPTQTGSHYFSLRLNPQNPNQIDLVNPYATQRLEQTLTEAQMEENFWPEMSRIRLGN